MIGVLLPKKLLGMMIGGYPTFESIHLYHRAAEEIKVKLIFFSSDGIHWEEQTVSGYAAKDVGIYVKKEVPLPEVVINRTRSASEELSQTIEQLKNRGVKVFNEKNVYDKTQVLNWLSEETTIQPFIPETSELSAKKFKMMSSKYPSLYMKPVTASVGIGILKVEKTTVSNKYTVYQNKQGETVKKQLTMNELGTLIARNRRPYQMQQGIVLKRYEGYPVDFRVSVQKDKEGQWQCTGIIGKLGKKKAIVTNLHCGGRPVVAEKILAAWTEDWREVYDRMAQLGIHAAKALEKKIDQLADIGLDIALDPKLHPWILEVNFRDLRVTFRDSGARQSWANTFRNPVHYAAYLAGVGKPRRKIRKKRLAGAIIAPGILPIPPVQGGSVETYLDQMLQALGPKVDLTVYSRSHPSLPMIEKQNTVVHQRFPYISSKPYLEMVLNTPDIDYQFVQVENRPDYIAPIKQMWPDKIVILSLHSLTYLKPSFISTARLHKALTQVDTIVVNSQFIKAKIADRFPELLDKIKVIYPGVNTEQFRPYDETLDKEDQMQLRAELELHPDNEVILFVGRFIPAKGFKPFIEAIPSILQQRKQTSIVIVGGPRYGSSKPTPFVQQLMDKMRKYKDKVKFVPFQKPEHIDRFYRMADLLVTPSIQDEAYGLVNLEAMSSGVPVLSTWCGGIPEVVEDGLHGKLIPLTSLTEGIIQQVIQMLDDKDSLQAMRTEARKRALERTWKHTADEWMELYKQNKKV